MNARPIQFLAAVTLATGAVVLLLATMSANAASLAAPSITWTDNFSSSSLESRWSWIREDPTRWSLTARPGFLRITTEQIFSAVNNLLVQNAPGGDYEIQTRVVFAPTENFQIAGLLIYQDDGNFVRLIRLFCDIPTPSCIGNGIYFQRIEGGAFTGSSFAMTMALPGDAYLRVTRQGNVYTGYVSEDGSNWIELGVHTVTIAPTKIGLGASNSMQEAAEIPADFDFFTLIDNSYHLFLPLVLK